MGFLNDHYCHDSLADVGDQIVSTMVFPDGWSPDGTYSTTSTSITFNVGTASERVFFPAECSVPGYRSFVGGDISMLVPMWSAGLVVIVVAWAIHMAKRALGSEGRRG